MKKPKHKQKRPKHWRKTALYRQWRRRVKSRDGRCQGCGAFDTLEAHHVITAHAAPNLRFAPENGITLCHSCHHQRHLSQ